MPIFTTFQRARDSNIDKILSLRFFSNCSVIIYRLKIQKENSNYFETKFSIVKLFRSDPHTAYHNKHGDEVKHFI